MPRIAVVQIEPSYMDPAAGLARIEEFTAEAAGQGAEIVVFPELLVPGYPRYIGDPFPHTDEGQASWADIQRYHRAYVEHAQVVPGPYTDALGHVARTHGVTLVVGLAERHPSIRSTLWNTGVVIGPDGRYLGKHRKLVAVMHERLYFNRGGREDIRTFQTPEANLGVCLCFENLQPLFRRALGRLGEEIHCALWTGPTPRSMAAEGVHLEQHREMGVTHALDTGTFVAISSQVTAREPDGGEHGSWWSHSGGSYIIDPLGRTIASVPDWEEGIAVADCDLSLIDDARLVWNAYSDDARDDLFGPGPVGDPVSALSAPLPAAGLAAGADGQVEAAPGQLALPSAEGAYEGAGHGD
jgi:predicted amidohydrolase